MAYWDQGERRVTTPADIVKIARYVIIHVEDGHADPAHSKYLDYVKDLGTLLTNTRRVLYEIRPPASEREIFSYLVTTVAEIDRRTETFVSVIGDQIKASATSVGDAANAAANRVIDLINADRSVIEGLQAQAAADAEAIATLQAQIDAGTVTPEAAQEVVDIHNAAIAKLADLDSDPLTPV